MHKEKKLLDKFISTLDGGRLAPQLKASLFDKMVMRLQNLLILTKSYFKSKYRFYSFGLNQHAYFQQEGPFFFTAHKIFITNFYKCYIYSLIKQ